MNELKRATAANPSDSVHWLQARVGLAALALGALVYVVDRPPEANTVFSAVSLAHVVPNVFGAIGASLPTFTHVLAFSLLTAAWLGGSRTAGLASCLGWLVIDAAAELGQLPALARPVSAWIPHWFESVPLLDRTDGYFRSGTFDVADVVSVGLGALVAYLLIRCTAPKDASHVRTRSS